MITAQGAEEVARAADTKLKLLNAAVVVELPMKSLSTKILALLSLLVSTNALASSHAFIMMGRSSMERYVFVSQCVEGEFGQYTLSGDSDTKADWQGYNFRSGVGIELFKFIQVGAFHTFVNMHHKDASTERITGSKLGGELKFAFAAPVGNLELGTGFTAARLDYQKQMDQASMYGSGIYYIAGVNYFTSSQVSVFTQVRQNQETMVRGSGSSKVKKMQASTMGASLGFNVWL